MKPDLLHEVSHVNDMIARSARRIELSRVAVAAARSQKLRATALLQSSYLKSVQEDRQA